jgi:hypothetical protein
MKRIILFHFGFFFFAVGWCQNGNQKKSASDTTPSDTIRRRITKEIIEKDIDTLYPRIDTLNDYLQIFIKRFETCVVRGNDEGANAMLDAMILQDTLKIEAEICKIQKQPFYGDSIKTDRSLYFYINKELKDYLNSLELLKDESLHLMDSDCILNAFSENNCLNAYHYMSICRSLLLARLDNVQNMLDDRKRFDRIQKDITRLDSFVRQPIVPYYKGNEKFRQIINQPDKVNSAANAILFDQRHNWWWRSLLVGAVSALGTGILVHNMK